MSADRRDREIEALRERLSRLSEAWLLRNVANVATYGRLMRRSPLCSIVGSRREAVEYRCRNALEDWGGRMRDTGTPTRQRRPRKEAVRLGKEIYQRDILPQVETDHFGEYVAIDVETGDWAVADTTRVAVERLREQRPDAVDVLCERVGYRALRSFGAGSLRRAG